MGQSSNPYFIWLPESWAPKICAPEPRPHLAMLFCLPFAGGSAAYYAPWRKASGHSLDIVPVQLPGRGARIAEPPFQRMKPLVTALADVMTPLLGQPYALFGHSMGAAVAIALAHELKHRGLPPPAKLFVSGRRAPGVPPRSAPMHLMSDAALLQEIRRMDGTPDVVLADEELLALMLPTIRADLEVVETADTLSADKLPIPITAFGGEQDRVTQADLAAWERQTSADFALHMYPGGHFFLQSARDQMLHVMQIDLTKIARPQARTG